MKQYKNYLMDMDGVLVRGKTAIPGAQDFIDGLNERGIQYLVLTNNPMYTPRAVSYTHLRAHETVLDLVCRLLLEKKKNKKLSPT